MEEYIMMSLRVSVDLLTLMKRASDRYGVSFNQMTRMAQRRYYRLRPKLRCDKSAGNSPLKVTVVEKMDAAQLRAVISWYIGLHDLNKPPAVDLQALEQRYGSLTQCDVIRGNEED